MPEAAPRVPAAPPVAADAAAPTLQAAPAPAAAALPPRAAHASPVLDRRQGHVPEGAPREGTFPGTGGGAAPTQEPAHPGRPLGHPRSEHGEDAMRAARGTPRSEGPDGALRLAFAFTERDTPEARARIAEDLALIARVVRAADPSLVALVLTGGFSRGEGTVRDGRPVNDYDLVAVRGRPGGDALYRRLGHELTERVGIEVDLMPIWRLRLPLVGRKLFWLDVALGGQVVTGDPEVLRALPTMTAGQMPRQEAARLLGNRAAGLLLALPGPQAPTDPEQVDLQSAKAVLAAMDAALLHEGTYAARLRDRLELSRGHPRHAAFAAAVEWKLRGSQAAARVGWEEAASVLLDAVGRTDARRVRDGLAEHAVHALRARRLRASPSQRLRLGAWELLEASRFPEGPDPEAARAILARLGRVEPDAADWPGLKKAFFALRAKTLQ